MDNQIVNINDLQFYDEKLRKNTNSHIEDNNIKPGVNSILSTLKISIVSAFPATADPNTIYIIPTSSIIDISEIPESNIRIGSTPIKGINIGDIRIW